MPSNWKQRVMAAVAVAAVAAALVIAFVGTGGHHHRHGHRTGHGKRAQGHGHGRGNPNGKNAQQNRSAPRDVVIAAGYLGLSKTELRKQMRAGKTLAAIAEATPGKSAAGVVNAIVANRGARIMKAVSDGRLSKSEEAMRLAQVSRRASAVVNRPGSAELIDLAVASMYLGVPSARIVTQMQSSNSLAQLADSTPHRSANGLIAALVVARRKQIEEAATAGTLSRERKRALLSTLQQRVSAAVHRARVAHPKTHAHKRAHRHKHSS